MEHRTRRRCRGHPDLVCLGAGVGANESPRGVWVLGVRRDRYLADLELAAEVAVDRRHDGVRPRE